MTDVEKYLFDLRGYIVIEDVLNADEVTELNRLIDENHPGVNEDSHKKHSGGFLTWGQALVDLIDHEAIMPRLKFILGDGFRLDHYYAIYMEQDGTASRLHGANTPYDPPEYYHYREGRMYNGLTVVTFNLADSGTRVRWLLLYSRQSQSQLSMPVGNPRWSYRFRMRSNPRSKSGFGGHFYRSDNAWDGKVDGRTRTAVVVV